jgi:hypothetical protein
MNPPVQWIDAHKNGKKYSTHTNTHKQNNE